ncbi:MAG: transcription termination/antitermination NusG family protein [Candidatus Shikimatogenerans bostrichidophilus]|nr:MAG: transcription termination/antitermination NusG family protein [Candidatus Shikimatogenerans bostrichidophilus]
MKKKWYILNIITRYEVDISNKIKNITNNKDIKVYNFIKKDIKIKNNKKYIYNRRLLPGYLIIYLKLDYLLLYKIKKINGVIGFLNERNNKLPIPLKYNEFKKFLKKNKKDRNIIKKGDDISINSGIFIGLIGKVEKIYKDKIEISIYIMGREVNLKIDKNKVNKI